MTTYTAKPGEIQRDWYVVDAEGKTLGVQSGTTGKMYAEARAAVREGRSPQGDREQAVLEEFLQAHAKVMGLEDTSEVAAALLKQYDEGREPRAERFWELVAILRGQDPSHTAVHAAAQRWIEDGLRSRLRSGEP